MGQSLTKQNPTCKPIDNREGVRLYEVADTAWDEPNLFNIICASCDVIKRNNSWKQTKNPSPRMQDRVTQFLAAPVTFTSVAVFLQKGNHSYW